MINKRQGVTAIRQGQIGGLKKSKENKKKIKWGPEDSILALFK